MMMKSWTKKTSWFVGECESLGVCEMPMAIWENLDFSLCFLL